ATLKKENADQRELLKIRKRRITGKRVALNGKFVFSVQEVLEIAREAEKVTADKSAHTRKRKRPAAVEIEEQEDELLKNVSSDSESDCIVVQSHRLQRKVVGWQSVFRFCACSASPRMTLSIIPLRSLKLLNKV
ncbi:hypothetical protein M433DRAFT_78825, partial [Acidomyces richmondensis BFW]